MATALAITLDEQRPLSLQQQLYTRLRDDILAGRLRSGERLPPSRVLATQLAVSRTTVVLVYDQLVAEGYAEARQGAGRRPGSYFAEQLVVFSGKHRLASLSWARLGRRVPSPATSCGSHCERTR